MHDAIREAHELIGATLRDPRTQRQGKVVGMDLGREQPAIYVLWQESAAAERIAMEPDDFRALMEHLRARMGIPPQRGTLDRSTPDSSTPDMSSHHKNSRHKSTSHKRSSDSRTKDPRGKEKARSDSRQATPSRDSQHAVQKDVASSTTTDDAIQRSAQG